MVRPTSLFAFALAALVAGAAGTAVAQPPAGGPPPGAPRGMGPGGPGGRGGMQALLFEGITLSDAQRAKVDSIQGARRAMMRERMQAMQGGTQGGTPGGGMPDSATMAARRQEMRTAMEQDRAAVRAVLTADQQKTFDANVARMQARQRERMQNGGPGGMGGPGAGPDRPAGGRD